MVGILLVSHSRVLAHSLVELALEAAPSAYIVGVGGAGPQGQDFGSDATAIMAAIEAAKISQEPKLSGLLVLMDIGSSLLAAQTAVELLGTSGLSGQVAEPGQSFPVKLCPGPLVEGALLAASQVVAEPDIETLFAEVLRSLEAKYQQLGCSFPQLPAAVNVQEELEQTGLEETFVVKLSHGLHARPAAKLVQLTKSYGVKAYIAKKNQTSRRASATRVLAITKLDVRCGDELLVSVDQSGPTGKAYLNEIKTLFNNE